MTLSKEAQQRYTGIAAGTSSGLSMIGSVYILGRYWYARRMKSKAIGAGTGHHIDVTKELIHVLAWLDLVGAVGRCFGVLPTQTFDQSKREPVTSVCQLQAFVITFGDVSPIAWNFLMAFNLFRWVCLGEDQQMLQRRIKWYVCATLLFTLAIDTLALGFNVYGDAGQWCWVVVPDDRPRELAWKLITLYVWVLLGAVAMGVLLVMVKMNVQDRLKGVDNDDARVAYHGVVQNLTIYIVAFIVCWMPAVLDRGYSAITGRDVFTLSMLHTAIVPLQGFVNAVIYGKFHVWVGRHLQTRPERSAARHDNPSKSSMDDAHEPDQRARQQSGTASIFVTSFDMNWHAAPPNLNDWVPPDHDLYVFSLQKCVSVQHVEQAIRKHLLQINYPMGYRSITSLAGAQQRGHMQAAAVCQIVFVNNSDIASGNFQFQTGDGRLWSQRKAFKSVVGIPMRYFEASLAFVSCNLSAVTSPSPNHLQMPQAPQDLSLSGKHATTMGLIQSFEMDADRAAVDFPYLYHHTILAGNFNYNIGMPCPRLTVALDQAYKAECLKRATDTALNGKLRNFGQSPLDATRGSPTALGLQPLGGREPTNSNVNVEWNLLYFKSRSSLGRASSSSHSSGDDDEYEYEEVFSAAHEGLPFTQLRSPAGTETMPMATPTPTPTPTATSFVSVSEPCRVRGSSNGQQHVQLDIAETSGEERTSPVSDERPAWLGFLNSLFPSTTASPVPLQRKSSRSASTSVDGAASAKRRGDLIHVGRGESLTTTHKKVGDWMLKSQLVAESAQRKWQELLRQDELRAGMEAKEILCGFEEPPIAFLPSFPRRVGTAASYSMATQQRTCKDVFVDPSEGLPAYKDRILVHSLPDTRERIRNVGYWLCEDITTSTHKPVCSVFELEIDRFFSFTTTEADKQDAKDGKLALKDKSHIAEYKIKLVNLDANIWTYVPVQRHSSIPLWRLRTPTPDPYTTSSSSSTGGAAGGSATEQLSTRRAGSAAATPAATRVGSDAGSTVSDTVHAHEPPVRSVGSLSSVLRGKIKRKSSSSSRGAGGTASALTRTGSHSGVSASSASASANRRGRLDSLSCDQFDLVPVDPSSIATVFPLPSEDVYALQRKIHEVAYSVQNGFQSSARDEDREEASLAYTNFRTVSWKEAMAHGVTHTAITKAVNGVVHVAIKIDGDGKKHGGQGILCIQEQDLVAHAAASIGDSDPIPFDLALTWGGRHVGYLHGDILSSL